MGCESCVYFIVAWTQLTHFWVCGILNYVELKGQGGVMNAYLIRSPLGCLI